MSAEHGVSEAACGTGIVTRAIRDAVPIGATIVATDLNPGMMSIAQEKFSKGEQVTPQPADGTDLPFHRLNVRHHGLSVWNDVLP